MPKSNIRRRPVVLIEVRGGVVQEVSHASSVNPTVHDHDSIRETGSFPCVWCGGLVEVGNHRCPSCDNPTAPALFSDLANGEHFICLNGGKWMKQEDKAECLERDSAFYPGEVVPFSPHTTVFPFHP